MVPRPSSPTSPLFTHFAYGLIHLPIRHCVWLQKPTVCQKESPELESSTSCLFLQNTHLCRLPLTFVPFDVSIVKPTPRYRSVQPHTIFVQLLSCDPTTTSTSSSDITITAKSSYNLASDRSKSTDRGFLLSKCGNVLLVFRVCMKNMSVCKKRKHVSRRNRFSTTFGKRWT